MELDFFLICLAILAGLVAGVVNTLAGSGSLLTLAVLLFLGLPATVANGTNRLGVAIQTAVSLLTLRRHGLSLPEGMLWVVVASTLGALFGSFVATRFDAATLEGVIIAVMWAMLLVLFIKPSRFLRSESLPEKGNPTVLKIFLFVLVGFWGGFLQAGVGILLALALVLATGRELVEATAIKLVVVMSYTVGTLFIFGFAGQINWTLGFLVGIGQGLGGFLGARFAATSPKAPIWIRRTLIAAILLAILELMNLRQLFLNLIGIG